MKIGIAGVGVIGGALYRWFSRHTSHELFLYDPPKGMSQDLSQADAVFICVPVPTTAKGPDEYYQDLSLVEETIQRRCTNDQVIFIRSSVLPGTADSLAEKYEKHVYAMPEFLTARNSDACMAIQDIIVGCPSRQKTKFYNLVRSMFENKKNVIGMSNAEAELTKYAHNGFGTVKVHFANKIYQLARALGCDYAAIKRGVLMTGYINDVHLDVPGPDGMLGYGGTCFPKDMDALTGALKKHAVLAGSLLMMQKENRIIRDYKEKTK